MSCHRLDKIKAAAGRFASHVELLARYGSDGCTGVPELNLTHCCNRHDVEYRSGVVSRADADASLRRCMQRKGWKVLPWIYWAAVRLIGWRFYRYDRRREYLEYKARRNG